MKKRILIGVLLLTLPLAFALGGCMDSDDKVESIMEKRTEVKITEEEAIQIAVEKVPGSTAEDVIIKLDTEDGRKVYDGKVIYDKKEFEFEINADNGEVISWEEDILD